MKKTNNTISKAGKCLLVFGVLFSQMSFPINVLADEFKTEVSSNEVEEVQDDELGQIQKQTDDSNSDILPDEDQSNEETDKTEGTELTIELIEGLCIIKSSIDTPVTKEQLTDSLADSTNITQIQVIDLEGNLVEEKTTPVQTGFTVTLIEEGTISYQVVILGDYDDNGILEQEDQQQMLTSLKETLTEEELAIILTKIDLNQDQKFNILDVTHPIFTTNNWNVDAEATDELITYLESDTEEVYIEEEIKVSYNIFGFEKDTLTGIEGDLNYNKDLLQLTKIEVNNIEQELSELENSHLVYLLDNYNTNGVLITLTFKTLASGTTEVSINNLVASLGGIKANLISENVSTSINILEYGKGGDVELEEETTSTTTTIEPTTTPVQTTVTTAAVQTVVKPVYVALSSDNSIKSLTIKNYEIDFNSNTYEYSLKVKNSVRSLDLTIVLNDEQASYTVSGNEKFKVGENTVTITVTAEDGTTQDYILKVDREKKETIEEEEEVKEETNSSKTVIIILIVLVIIGLIYVIFKDDEEESRESKK